MVWKRKKHYNPPLQNKIHIQLTNNFSGEMQKATFKMFCSSGKDFDYLSLRHALQKWFNRLAIILDFFFFCCNFYMYFFSPWMNCHLLLARCVCLKIYDSNRVCTHIKRFESETRFLLLKVAIESNRHTLKYIETWIESSFIGERSEVLTGAFKYMSNDNFKK